MSEKKRKYYKHLLVLEVNSYLKKIYSTMKPAIKMTRPVIRATDIRLLQANPLKSYEFKLSTRDKVAEGKEIRIITITRGIDKPIVRKQRALFIAAEIYVYHAMATQSNAKYFDRIKSQNQYLDMLKFLIGKQTANNTRDRAVRYVIEELDERHLAHHNPKGWFIRMGKIKKYDRHLAKMLGSSEKTFQRILKHQDENFNEDMLKMEENLIRKEMDDIQYLIEYLAALGKTAHLERLKTYLEKLKQIRANMHKWELKLTDEQERLKKSSINREELERLIDKESKAESIDINKVYLIFEKFEKEKINILKHTG